MTSPSSVSLHDIAHSFSELLKPLCHDKAVIHEGDLKNNHMQIVADKGRNKSYKATYSNLLFVVTKMET